MSGVGIATNPFASALESGRFVAGTACTDCYLSLCADGPGEPDPEWNEAAMLATLRRYEVTPGHLHSGPYSDCVHAERPCEDDCDCEHDPFSAAVCALCGTRTAGSRDAVTLVEREPDDEDGPEVCRAEDCGASLDDGEGYDGYCGTCADRLEAQGHWS
jgi:hypothetical protein